MATITFLIQLVHQLFPSLDYRWLTKEMNTNLPLELDFKVEVHFVISFSCVLHFVVSCCLLCCPVLSSVVLCGVVFFI